MIESLLPLAAASQTALAAAALALTYRRWTSLRRAARELKTRLEAENVKKAEVDTLLVALSNAERDGASAMKNVVELDQTSISRAVRELSAPRKEAVLRALTQPSDERRKRFLYELSPTD